MMDRTDRHFRFFLRQLSRRTLLYTEMVTTGALLHGDVARHLDYSPEEGPLALQLGGDDPTALANCARLAEDWGYSEVNLNCGCPSPRVQRGNFGAALMAEPARVADAVAAMRAAVSIPVTVKHRIGIDHLDSYEHMRAFVDTVAEAGCRHFQVHARIAWLDGLSPKDNRTIPPLRYADVYRLKAERPDLFIAINGGVRSLDDARQHLGAVDSAMIGRAAWDDPYLFAAADAEIFGEEGDIRSRAEIAESMLPYLERWSRTGIKSSALLRGMLQLYAGQPGTRLWKRVLSSQTHRPAPELLVEALAAVRSVPALSPAQPDPAPRSA